MPLLTRKAYREAQKKQHADVQTQETAPHSTLAVEQGDIVNPSATSTTDKIKKPKKIASDIDRFLNKAILLVCLLLALVIALFFV